MIYADINKRTRNGIEARIESTVKRYGYDAFRAVTIRYIKNSRNREKLLREIHEREEELQTLKGEEK